MIMKSSDTHHISGSTATSTRRWHRRQNFPMATLLVITMAMAMTSLPTIAASSRLPSSGGTGRTSVATTATTAGGFTARTSSTTGTAEAGTTASSSGGGTAYSRGSSGRQPVQAKQGTDAAAAEGDADDDYSEFWGNTNMPSDPTAAPTFYPTSAPSVTQPTTTPLTTSAVATTTDAPIAIATATEAPVATATDAPVATEAPVAAVEDSSKATEVPADQDEYYTFDTTATASNTTVTTTTPPEEEENQDTEGGIAVDEDDTDSPTTFETGENTMNPSSQGSVTAVTRPPAPTASPAPTLAPTREVDALVFIPAISNPNDTSTFDGMSNYTSSLIIDDDDALNATTNYDAEEEETEWPLYGENTEATTQEPTTEAPQTQQEVSTTNNNIPQHAVSGQVSLQLYGIPTPFYEGTRTLFLASAEEFIGSSRALQTVADIRVSVIYQRLVDASSVSGGKTSQGRNNNVRRGLQQQKQQRALVEDAVLQVDLGVDGMAYDESLTQEDWDLWLYQLFQAQGREFVNLVKDFSTAEGNSFFQALDHVVAMEPVPVSLVAAPTSAPTKSVLVPPLIITNGNTTDLEDEDSGWPLWAVVGAAIGGVVFIIAGLLLIRFVLKLRAQKQQPEDVDGNVNEFETADADGSPTWARGNKNTRASRTAKRPSAGGGGDGGSVSSASGSYLYTSSAGRSQDFQQLALQETDSQSQMGGTTNGDMSIMDNASYAYSLEPGIEPSLAGMPQGAVPSGGASAMSYSIHPGGSSVASMTSGASSFLFSKLPWGNKQSPTGSGGALSPSSALSGKPTKDVIAPAGKLGIVIDTTIDGPVVHKVNPGSALEGLLESGDIIVAIDNVDTRAMTASAITALMVKTANQRRKLTVISP